MKCQQSVMLAVGVLLSASATGFGQIHEHLRNHEIDKVRNNLWPMPFRSQDTCSVLQYLEVQRNNGWKLFNTLGTPMFDPELNKLSDSGRAHLNWIINRAPASRRVIFVLRGTNDEQTRQRVEATQLAVSELLPVGQLPEIYLTNSEPNGSSGVYQTTIHRAMVSSVPSPRIPASAAASSSPSGSSEGN